MPEFSIPQFLRTWADQWRSWRLAVYLRRGIVSSPWEPPWIWSNSMKSYNFFFISSCVSGCFVVLRLVAFGHSAKVAMIDHCCWLWPYSMFLWQTGCCWESEQVPLYSSFPFFFPFVCSGLTRHTAHEMMCWVTEECVSYPGGWTLGWDGPTRSCHFLRSATGGRGRNKTSWILTWISIVSDCNSPWELWTFAVLFTMLFNIPRLIRPFQACWF